MVAKNRDALSQLFTSGARRSEELLSSHQFLGSDHVHRLKIGHQGLLPRGVKAILQQDREIDQSSSFDASLIRLNLLSFASLIAASLANDGLGMLLSIDRIEEERRGGFRSDAHARVVLLSVALSCQFLDFLCCFSQL